MHKNIVEADLFRVYATRVQYISTQLIRIHSINDPLICCHTWFSDIWVNNSGIKRAPAAQGHKFCAHFGTEMSRANASHSTIHTTKCKKPITLCTELRQLWAPAGRGMGGRANVLRQRARSLAVEQRSYRNSLTFMDTNGIEGPLYTVRTTLKGHWLRYMYIHVYDSEVATQTQWGLNESALNTSTMHPFIKAKAPTLTWMRTHIILDTLPLHTNFHVPGFREVSQINEYMYTHLHRLLTLIPYGVSTVIVTPCHVTVN